MTLIKIKKRPHALYCEDASRAQQQFKDGCDINVILRKYAATGILPGRRNEANYLDETPLSGLDYKAALDRIQEADRAFDELPAALRAEFQNQPANLLGFLDDPDNLDRAAELGLVAAPERQAVEPAPTPAEAPPPPPEPAV